MSEIKITIDGQKYTINPKITLGEYMSISKLNKKEYSSLKLLHILTGIPEDKLKEIDNKRARVLLNKLINEKMGKQEKKVHATFEFKDKLYGLETDLTKLNFGGWVDLETFIAMGHIENMDKIAAVFYRPIRAQIGKTYVLEEYDSEDNLKRAEEFKDLPFELISGANTFFLTFTEMYIKNMIHSLKKKNKKQERRIQAASYMKKILPNYLYGKLPPGFTNPN